jgi:thiamine biosynthesis protein ThiS
MITISVNGEPCTQPESITLLALIESLGVKPETVAAQHNDRIVERAALDEIHLCDGDVVELIRIVGGG